MGHVDIRGTVALRDLARWLPAGVRSRLRRSRHDLGRYAALVHALREHLPRLEFGVDAHGPWVAAQSEGIRLHGFASEPLNLELFELLAPDLPRGLNPEQFRLARDYVTRWVYPHMRPDLGPEAFSASQREGLHGQHKDDISVYPDASARARLAEAFRPKPGDVVIDCGAFVGFGAIRMARDAPGGRVLAVEASSDCFVRLASNIRENRASGVTPLHNAVWKTETELELEKTVAQGNSLLKDVVAGARTEVVRTVSVDHLVREHRLAKVDMVSLTLNGAELEAVEGAAKTLAEMRPRIRAAGWYKRDGRPVHEKLKPMLESAGYDVFVGLRGNVMALPVRAR